MIDKSCGTTKDLLYNMKKVISILEKSPSLVFDT